MEEDIYRRYHDPDAPGRVAGWCEERLAAWPVEHDRAVWDTVAGPTHVVTAGPADAPTVVFVHGSNRSAATHLDALTALAADHRVVAPDLPGEPGLSNGRRVQDARVHQLGAWLTEVVDRVDRPVTLVGHGLGAAAALAATSPHIRRRVLVCPGGVVRPRLPLTLVWAALAWRVAPGPGASRRLLARLGTPDPDPHTTRWMTSLARAVRLGRPLLPLQPQLTEHLGGLDLVLVAGRDDPMLPPDLVRQGAQRLGATTVELPCGHVPDAAGWRDVAELVRT